MSEGIKCFVIEPSGMARRVLRRYVQKDEPCPAHPTRGYHNAETLIGKRKVRLDARGYQKAAREKYEGDPRWPQRCECGYVFQKDDERQVNEERIYIDVDCNEYTLHDRVPGMMYDAWWMPDRWKGPDGKSLMVVCPDGSPWNVDGRANNCTDPEDWVHRCWVRHGEWPDVTVDKNGLTCNAGAGSIDTGKWHGFLRSGYLVPC